MASTTLRIDASMRTEGSISRRLTDDLIAALKPATVIIRDLAKGMSLIDETWIGANFTDADARSADQKATLALSDELVAELQAADTIVIGMPVYNFGVPAALKAWVDQIARARVTFKYTETGPVGLLTDKTVFLVMASAGVTPGSDVDFAAKYMRFILGFVGITDVRIIDGSAQQIDAAAAMARAEQDIAKAA